MEEEFDYYQVAKELNYDFEKLESLSIKQYDKILALLCMKSDTSAARSQAEEPWAKKKNGKD